MTCFGHPSLALKMLCQAGFPDVTAHQLAHDFQHSFHLMRKPAA